MKAGGAGCPGKSPGAYGWMGQDAAAPAPCENQRPGREKGPEMANPWLGRGDAGDTAGTAPRVAVPGELTAANPCFSA